MAPHDKTPAPSRRFLPSSSSSTVKSTIGSASRKTAFQFVKPSQSSSVASPFGRTPQGRSSSGFAERDDIDQDSNDDDVDNKDEDLIPQNPKAPKQQDKIEDSSQLSAEANHEWAKDSYYDEEDDDDLYSPILKRRRMNAPSRTIIQPITISSSPSEDLAVDQLVDEELLPNPVQPPNEADTLPEVTTTTQSHNKFRSGIQSKPTPSSPPTKPTLKSIFGQQRSHQQTPTESALPDAFSPSKRKGRIDYEPGGAADTVRSWILQAAIDETHQTNHAEERIHLAEVHDDVSGRFVSVRDGDEQVWLLPCHAARKRVDGSLMELCEVGDQVVIKGTATTWAFELGGDVPGKINFAADWHVAR